jgi:hypothetical protein
MILLLGVFALGLSSFIVKANEGYDQGEQFLNYDPTALMYPSDIKSTFDMFSTTKKGGDDCPPCFNCMLPGFECLHFANCSEYDGKCNCPPGFGGDDCKQPCM